MRAGIIASGHRAASGGGLTFLGSGQVTTDSSTPTWTLPFGTPAANRVIIAAFGLRVASGAGLVSISIGGVSATIDIRSTTWPSGILAHAIVPTGTSGDVVLTYSSAESTPSSCAVYGGYGTLTVDDTATSYVDTSAAATLSGTVTCTAGGMLIATLGDSVAVYPATVSWTGVDADFVFSNDGGSSSMLQSSGSSLIASAGDVTVSAAVSKARRAGLAAACYSLA